MRKRTAYIGAYGYGNLGDELVLTEAMQSFPPSQAFVYTVDADWTARCVPGINATFATRQELLALRPERIVYGGGHLGTLPGFAAYTGWMAEAQQQGAECHIHNIGMGRLGTEWLDEPRRNLLRTLASFTVRDHKSLEMTLEWGIGRLPGLSFFPERAIEPDFSLADRLIPPGKRVIGISVINYDFMDAAMAHEADRIRALLDSLGPAAILPVVSQQHRSPTGRNDATGFRHFAEQFLQGREIIGQEILDYRWWYQNLTPRTLKGLIARCSLLISERKHNCVHGIGAGIPTIGFHPRRDDSLMRLFVSLSPVLPPGSRLVSLEDPAGQG